MFREFTGKTTEEAIEEGLKELGLKKDEVKIVVVDEGKKKLFGWKNAVVKIAPLNEESEDIKEDVKDEKESAENFKEELLNKKTDGQRTVEFLENLLKLMNTTAVCELVKEDEKIEINLTSSNSTLLIGKRGAVLDALQTLAGAVANTGREEYRRVSVDCENYRENREETLTKLAGNLASKAVRIGKKIKLEPMNPYERRIIHAALAENEEVQTTSEGKEPSRYVVIIPNDCDPNEEAIPAREERKPYNGRNKNYGNKKSYGNRKNYGNRGRNSSGFSRKSAPKRTEGDFFGTFLGNSKDDNN